MKIATKTQERVRKITLENEQLQFTFMNSGPSEEVVTLKAGPAYVASTFFSNEYPNDSEMEKALDYIEGEFTEHKELKNNNEQLVCSDLLLAEILENSEKRKVSRETVEEVFDRYVDCAYGEPARVLGIEYSLEKLTKIMLVRSVMYYLDFDQIEVG